MTAHSNIDTDDQMTMIKIKSLLSQLRYLIKDSDLEIVDRYHTVCRRYCSWEVKNKIS